MKLAIIGSGPLAIFCARYFDQLGAEVVLFQKNALGGNVRFLLNQFPQIEFAFEGKNKSIKEFWETDLVPAISLLEERHLTRAGEVLRVHKRFLHPGESISNKSRLHDLFRVIFSVNPKDAILKQLEENPEMFQKLGEQVVNSLHAPVESFEDFDIVIEARGLGLEPLPMGPSNAWALNENNIRQTSPIFYQKDILTKLNLEGKKQIVLVGNDDCAVLALMKCKDWLFSNPEYSLSWVSYSKVTADRKNKWINGQLQKILAFSDEQFDKDKTEFEKKMHAWRDLEDYEKVKIPKPIEPKPKIILYEGYDVTSVDRLLDREGIFATLETPDFREFVSAPNDLKTLPAETILVACGVAQDFEFAKGIATDEPGYYRLDADDLESGMLLIKDIEQKILSFFSRAQ